MCSVCFYFQVHQPTRLKKMRIFDIGQNHDYFQDEANLNLSNQKILEKVANKCYLPANELLLKLLKKHSRFKISFSLSGVLLEQLEKYCPRALESFQKLIKTGRAEVLDETYYHSLAFIYSKPEFKHQVKKHREKIRDLFSKKPAVFRNTELIYNNDLAKEVEDLGYRGILIEGADHILKGQSPNFLRRAKGTKNLKVLLKNYQLSDDIAFRFSEKSWPEFPLTPRKFAAWISANNQNNDIINLFMDYETFGEHQWKENGIFEFLSNLPYEILKDQNNDFATPSEALDRYSHIGEVDAESFVSWADTERDLSAWLDNSMQKEAIKHLYGLEQKVLESDDDKLIEDWRKLQTSDHFYYMCTKWFADGDVHKYFNPYESPYEAFINYMNTLADLKLRLKKIKKSPKNLTISTSSPKL